MRVEANVSLRPRGTEPFGTRVEVKNMNSFRSVERAIAFEIERQAAALDAGETLAQETRGWDENRGATYVMRSRRTRTTTATSRSRTCRRSASTRPGSTRSGPALPELPAARRARYATDVRAVGLRRGGPRRPSRARPPCSRALAGRRDRSIGRRRSRTGSPASTCGLLQRRRRRGRPGRRRAELARSRRRVVDGRARPGRTPRRSSPPTPTTGEPVAAIIDARGLPPDLRHRRPRPRSSTRCIAANPAAVADYRAGKARRSASSSAR